MGECGPPFTEVAVATRATRSVTRAVMAYLRKVEHSLSTAENAYNASPAATSTYCLPSTM